MFSVPLASYVSTAQGAAASGNSYGPSSSPTLAQIIGFHGGSRTLYWRFDLLHNDRTYKGDITSFVTKAVVQHDSTRAVQRSLDLDMVETVASQSVTISGGTITSAGISYTTDLVQPVALIKVPGTSEWLHFPLGQFWFDRPGVSVPGYAVVRHASMPDWTSVVQKNKATDATAGGIGIPLTLPPDKYVIDVITSLLSNAPTNVPSNPAMLNNLPGCALNSLLPSNVTGAPAGNTPGDWPTTTQIDAKIPSRGYLVNEGDDYLSLINHLLETCRCYPLMSDQNGVFRIQRWPSAMDYRTVTSKDGYNLSVSPFSQYTYTTTQDSIVSFGLEESIMIDDIANVVEVIVEDGYRTTFKATASNDDPNSPYSTLNFRASTPGVGQRVVKVVREPTVPDVGASGVNYAQEYARFQLMMASWLTDEVQLPIAVNPLHAGGMDRDIVSLDIYQQYVAAGSAQNNPVISGAYIAASGGDPGLVVTENFVVNGWTITATLASPGSGSNLTGNVGLTTVLEPREQKSGHTMSLTCHRITSTVSPAHVTVS